jgi:hypothetical protein
MRTACGKCAIWVCNRCGWERPNANIRWSGRMYCHRCDNGRTRGDGPGGHFRPVRHHPGSYKYYSHRVNLSKEPQC